MRMPRYDRTEMFTMKNGKVCVYIAGPMTGYENWNFDQFNAAEAILRERGYEVINPASFGSEDSWQDCLRRDFKHIMEFCDIIMTLPNWHESRGATLEVFVCSQIGMPVESFTPKSALPKAKPAALVAEGLDEGVKV